MGKEFIEYYSENGKIPYSASTLCFCLTQYVKDYIASDREIICKVDIKVSDAVLVDAINFLGSQGGIDFGLHTKDLYDGKIEKGYVDPQCILTVVLNHYAYYIFNECIVESVLRNNHMNECTEEFDVNDGVVVLLDFINYIAERNEYDRIFTIKDLYEKAQKQNHNKKLNELKLFLELVSDYSERLNNGENIDSIFNEMAHKHDLKFISKSGVYHYTDEIKERVKQSQMFAWDRQDVEKEIYAMAYAYAKSDLSKQTKTQTEIIRKKIKEMKIKNNMN